MLFLTLKSDLSSTTKCVQQTRAISFRSDQVRNNRVYEFGHTAIAVRHLFINKDSIPVGSAQVTSLVLILGALPRVTWVIGTLSYKLVSTRTRQTASLKMPHTVRPN
jgi:hypothetical protein